MPTRPSPTAPTPSATASRRPALAALSISPTKSRVAPPARFMLAMYGRTSAVSRTPTVRSVTWSPLPDRGAQEVGGAVGVVVGRVRAALELLEPPLRAA